jgi:hypothetical protein
MDIVQNCDSYISKSDWYSYYVNMDTNKQTPCPESASELYRWILSKMSNWTHPLFCCSVIESLSVVKRASTYNVEHNIRNHIELRFLFVIVYTTFYVLWRTYETKCNNKHIGNKTWIFRHNGLNNSGESSLHVPALHQNTNCLRREYSTSRPSPGSAYMRISVMARLVVDQGLVCSLVQNTDLLALWTNFSLG